jgi:type II secretory pathway component GspD/PulD (secretin)
LFAALAIVGALASCAAPVRYPGASERPAAADAQALRGRMEATTRVAETSDPYIRAIPIDYAAPVRGGVSVHVSGAPLQQVIESVARPRGYAVSLIGTVRGSMPVSVELSNETFAGAARSVALAAGYVAVVDEHARQVMIADEATQYFRMPPPLAERTSSQFSVQGNPGFGAANPAATGMPANAGGATTAAGATAVATAPGSGGSNSSINGMSIRSSEALIAALASIIGGNAANRIQYVPETALVAVRGNALQLRRVADLMDAVTRESELQIEVEAAFVDVSLTRQFELGIDWSRVIPTGRLLGSGTSVALQVNGAAAVAAPTLQATVSGNSVKSIINALEALTRVRVVAAPSAIARNHMDVILYRGQQVPYLAEVDQQAVANVGTTTTARLGFVPEGTSLALRAAVVDANRIDLRIAPQQIQGVTFQTFSFGANASVTAPNFPLMQAFLSLLVEPGKTYVIGGLNLDRDNDADQHVPGLAGAPLLDRLVTTTTRAGERTQLVMLLTARILPPPPYVSSLVGESL